MLVFLYASKLALKSCFVKSQLLTIPISYTKHSFQYLDKDGNAFGFQDIKQQTQATNLCYVDLKDNETIIKKGKYLASSVSSSDDWSALASSDQESKSSIGLCGALSFCRGMLEARQQPFLIICVLSKRQKSRRWDETIDKMSMFVKKYHSALRIYKLNDQWQEENNEYTLDSGVKYEQCSQIKLTGRIMNWLNNSLYVQTSQIYFFWCPLGPHKQILVEKLLTEQEQIQICIDRAMQTPQVAQQPSGVQSHSRGLMSLIHSVQIQVYCFLTGDLSKINVSFAQVSKMPKDSIKNDQNLKKSLTGISSVLESIPQLSVRRKKRFLPLSLKSQYSIRHVP